MITTRKLKSIFGKLKAEYLLKKMYVKTTTKITEMVQMALRFYERKECKK